MALQSIVLCMYSTVHVNEETNDNDPTYRICCIYSLHHSSRRKLGSGQTDDRQTFNGLVSTG
eukprot:scaffold2115_cov97-Cylindrotheca_fusiformis.AAC.4